MERAWREWFDLSVLGDLARVMSAEPLEISIWLSSTSPADFRLVEYMSLRCLAKTTFCPLVEPFSLPFATSY